MPKIMNQQVNMQKKQVAYKLNDVQDKFIENVV